MFECHLLRQGYGDVTLLDCFALFAQEESLDGDEKPVNLFMRRYSMD